MARQSTREFEPFSSPLGGHDVVRRGPMDVAGATAATSFGRGALVGISTAGTVISLTKTVTPMTVAQVTTDSPSRTVGVAINGPEDPGGTLVAGSNFNDWRTGLVPTTGMEISFIPVGSGNKDQLWVTRNLQAAEGTDTAPTYALVGDLLTVHFDNTTAAPNQAWCLSTTAATYGTQVGARVIAILNDQGRRYLPGETPVLGDRIVFQFVFGD